MGELVSVILPTFNREKTILKSIDSVLKQTYVNLELIIIDDGSTDDTMFLIKKIKDDRLRILVNSENKGANYSRNRGVKAAIGDFIAFQDSDDIWKLNKLEKCINALKENQVDLVFSGMTKHGRNYKRRLPLYNLNDFSDKYHQLLLQNCVSTQTLVGKKECFLDCKFDENMPKMQDWDIILRLVKKYSIYYVCLSLVDVYIQNDSITLNKKDIEALKILYYKHKDYINSHLDIKSSLCLLLGDSLENHGENGKKYFKEAYLLDKSFEKKVFYLLSKCRLYFVFIFIKKMGRMIIAKLK